MSRTRKNFEKLTFNNLNLQARKGGMSRRMNKKMRESKKTQKSPFDNEKKITKKKQNEKILGK